jgi:two-component system response regulator FixJ
MATEIFVIDDDQALRDSLTFLLETAGYAVRCFESAQKFLEKMPTHAGGVILTDVRMPGIGGIELLRRLKTADGKIESAVVVMTGHGDISLAVEAMKLGAIDFLEKPFDDDRLFSAIRSAAPASSRSKGALSSEATARIGSLSQRERQVMQGLIEGLSNKVIAANLDISPRTVEVYRANVMGKLQVSNISELIRFAFRSGMIEEG